VSTSAEPSARLQGLALVLFTACGWGMAWPLSKYLLTMLPPYSMRAASSVLGCALAFAAAWWQRERIRPPPGHWPRIVLFALLNYGIFTTMTTWALNHLKASEAVTITYTIPVWAALFAWPILRERPTPAKLLALVLALGGVALLVGADTAQATWTKLPAAAMALTAAVTFGLGTVLGKQAPLRLPPTTAVAWQVLIGTAPMMVFACFEDPDWPALTPGGWAGILYIALVPMLLAYLAWFRALRLVPASVAATSVLISPVIGVLGSALFLGETFGAAQLAGLAMTLAGVALAARG